MKAAACDPSRQSQFSRQIKELEDWFEVQLLDRSYSPSIPTEVARSIAKQAEMFLRSMEEVRLQTTGGRQTVKFGAGERMIRSYLIPWVAHQREKLHRFVFKNQTTATIRTELINGRLDFGVIKQDQCPQGFEAYPIKPIPMNLVMAQSLAKQRKRWDWKHLSEIPIVLMEGQRGFDEYLNNKCKEHGVILEPIFECTSWGQVLDIMRERHVAAFVPKDIENQTPEGYSRVNLSSLSDYKEHYIIAWDSKLASQRPELTRLIGLIKNR